MWTLDDGNHGSINFRPWHRATKVGHLDAHDGEICDIEVDEDRRKNVAGKATAQPWMCR